MAISCRSFTAMRRRLSAHFGRRGRLIETLVPHLMSVFYIAVTARYQDCRFCRLILWWNTRATAH
jgi:hypothetical protein